MRNEERRSEIRARAVSLLRRERRKDAILRQSLRGRLSPASSRVVPEPANGSKIVLRPSARCASMRSRAHSAEKPAEYRNQRWMGRPTLSANVDAACFLCASCLSVASSNKSCCCTGDDSASSNRGHGDRGKAGAGGRRVAMAAGQNGNPASYTTSLVVSIPPAPASASSCRTVLPYGFAW